MKKYTVTLTKEERKFLTELTSKGRHRSQKVLNALVLLACDKGEYQNFRSTNAEISKVLNTSMRKIDRVKKRFVTGGLDVALSGKKSDRVYPKKADGDFEAYPAANPLKGFHAGHSGCLPTGQSSLNILTAFPMKQYAGF